MHPLKSLNLQPRLTRNTHPQAPQLPREGDQDDQAVRLVDEGFVDLNIHSDDASDTRWPTAWMRSAHV